MTDANTEERKLAEDIQSGLAEMKDLAKKIMAKSARLGQINRDAGRLVQGDDALEFEGMIERIRGDIKIAHTFGSRALRAGYDNGGEILPRGGGGR